MKKIILLLVLIVFVVGCQNQEQLDEVNRLNTQLNETKIQLEKKDNQITKLNNDIENIKTFNKYYNKAIENYNLAIRDGIRGDYNFESFGFNWDNDLLEAAIDTCKATRENYATSNHKYQMAISNFEEVKKYDNKEIIDYYINASDTRIDMQWLMYEACEYFEGSAYSYIRGRYESGDTELAKANKKLIKHDSMVKEHNRYLSKIEVLLE